VFVTAGMGGGTGTGAAPLIAGLAKEKDVLTIAVVTKPFNFEGRKRMENAEKGVEALRKVVDSLVIIPNEKLFKLVPKGTSIVDTFRYADDVLRQGVQGISNIIVDNSLINLDFADINTIMKNRGLAHMGIGRAKGDRKIFDALSQAVSSPLLETTIEGATGIIFNVKGGVQLPIDQVHEAADLMREIVDPECNIIFGTSVDESLEDAVEITVIATGFKGNDTPSLLETQEEEKPSQDDARYNNEYSDFLLNRFKEKQQQEEKQQTFTRSASSVEPQKTNTSKISVDESDIPPFLRKLRNK
jgi:cell division protein FtsZ